MPSAISPIDDLTTRAALTALDAISVAEQAVSNNIANAATPNYKASRVDFAGALSAAIEDGTPESATFSATPIAGALKSDGNNVDATSEYAELQRLQLQFQAATQVTNYRFTILSSAIG